ncbi:hypothetical protein CEB3_c22670 [Peptococcaceae bacterium CEB3]|nr:hypothetical protein CEB3_c22670 [Peptococcaceae bacterium CEB3]
MSKEEIAALACKILGVYLVVQGINVMLNVSAMYWFAPQQGPGNNVLLMISPFLFLIVFGVLLWLLSDNLGATMVKGEPKFREDSAITANSIQRVAFSVLGLLLLGNSLPKLVSDLVNLYLVKGLPNSAARLFGPLGFTGVIVQFVIGLGIFLGSQGLVNLLKIVRGAGLAKDKEPDDND